MKGKIKQLFVIITSLFIAFLLQINVYAEDINIRYIKQIAATEDTVTVEWSTDKRCKSYLSRSYEYKSNGKYSFNYCSDTVAKEVAGARFPTYRQTVKVGNSKEYHYIRVRAVDSNGFLADEKYINVIVKLKTNNVIKLTQKSSSKDDVTLQWNLVPGAKGYRIYTIKENRLVLIKDIDNKHLSSKAKIKWSDILTSVYVVPYNAAVHSYSGLNNCSTDAKNTFTIEGRASNRLNKSDIKPPKVNIKTLDYRLFAGDHSCFVSWEDKVNGASELYEVEIRDVNSKLLSVEIKHFNNFNFLLPRANTVFKIRVRAFFYKNNGKRTYGPWSDSGYIIPQPKMSSYKPSKNIKLTWDKMTDCSYYKVFVADSMYGKYKTLKKTSNNYISINYKKYKNKYFYVVAYVQDGLKMYKSCSNWRFSLN